MLSISGNRNKQLFTAAEFKYYRSVALSSRRRRDLPGFCTIDQQIPRASPTEFFEQD